MPTYQESTELVLEDLQRLLSLSPVVHYIANATGDYEATFISDGVKAQLGYEPHQFTQDPGFWATHIHPDDRQRVLAELVQLNKDQRHAHEYRFQHANGTWRWMYDEAVLVRDGAGKPERIIGSWLDITELSETAKARVLAEESLIVAKEEAERANLVKSRFLVAANHDLRQPLQSSQLYLSALLRQLEDDGAKEIARKIDLSLGVMQDILDSLLDISRLSNGSVIADKHDFALKGLLDAVVSSNLPHAEKKGLGLHIENATCTVHSDPTLLQRVIDNFVANAIRYTEKGSVCIGCSCMTNSARIEVTDTGVGIPADAVEHIFDEYVQLDNSVRDSRKGFGLGLSIAKQISQLLGCRLDVTSRVGVGSTFSIEVPLGEELARPVSEEAPENSPCASQDRVLLFIDDDPAIVDSMSIAMDLAGFKIHAVGTGDEALDYLKQGLRPDIVLSDYWLPGMTGIEVIRRIRENVGHKIPAILMTGDTSTQKIEAAGLDDCRVVHKPFNLDSLIALIEELTA